MFNAFTPLAGGNLETYLYPKESNLDLDAGLDYTRLPTAFAVFPFPVVLGYVNGFVPLMDNLERSMMLGKLPSGPVVNMLQSQAMQMAAFPNIMGSLAKVTG